jgi:hypothetical protein
LAEPRSWLDGSPEPPINPNRPVAGAFEHLSRPADGVGSGSNRFAVFAALAIRSFVGAQARSGRRVASRRIRSGRANHLLSTPGRVFRHPQVVPSRLNRRQRTIRQQAVRPGPRHGCGEQGRPREGRPLSRYRCLRYFLRYGEHVVSCVLHPRRTPVRLRRRHRADGDCRWQAANEAHRERNPRRQRVHHIARDRHYLSGLTWR